MTRSRRSERRVPSAGVIAAIVLTVALGGWFVWDRTRIHPTPPTTFVGYAPRIGDVVFQSLPHGTLSDLIEAVTASELSHCGIVALDRGRWVVIEAIGPVKETPLDRWIHRGRGERFWAYRLTESTGAETRAFIDAARNFLGRPYDARYRWDDERIYCSELVEKSYERAFGKALGERVRLGDLDWQGHVAAIRRYEGGEPPLERRLITPRDLARAPALQRVFGPEDAAGP